MSTSIGGVRIVDMPDLGTVTDNSSFVGEHAGSGRFSAPALASYARHNIVGGDNTTDFTVTIQQAVDTCAAAGGGVVRIARGIYKISAAIVVPTNAAVLIVGEGVAATVIRQTSPTADGIIFNCDSYIAAGGGVANLTVEAGAGLESSGFFGSGSSGTGINVSRANDNFITRDVGIANFSTGLALHGCWNTRHSNLRIMFCASAGIIIDKASTITGGGNSISFCKISNAGFSGDNTASIGLRVRASSGDYFNTMDITTFQTGCAIDPVAGDQVLYLFLHAVLADTSGGGGWYINGSGGDVFSIVCTNCWASFSGGDGLTVTGVHVRDIQWNGCRSQENVGDGIRVEAGGLRVFGGSVIGNSRLASNTYPGVHVLADVSDWAIIGTRIGNDGSAPAFTQAEGIVIDVGASDEFQIIGCDLSDPGTGKSPIANGATGGYFMVAHNMPRTAAGLNPNGAVYLAGTTSAAVAAASTVWLGANGAQAAELNTSWRAPRFGVLTGVRIIVVTPPGAGQSFTYTFFVNGAPTVVTGILSGTGVSVIELATSALLINADQAISIRLQTSATAVATQHSYSLRLE